MNRKFLEDLGLEKEAIDKIMGENGKDVERAKGEATTAQNELETVKGQLAEANKTIEGFGDHEDLKNQVEEYKTKISTMQSEQEAKESKKALMDQISKYAGEKGAKDIDVISSLAKFDDLMASKTQDTDIKSFIDGLAESKAYLFGANEPFNNPVGATGGNPPAGDDVQMSAMMAAMGIPAAK